eukprot:CAMPEP_0206025546 /NCGR_PEP_ID=MMETSP1464-20131121/40213_1 /ASSEMBLY_ACC=CAM_ASM_001124 /TAXON_ID=119497 /ORGANISM="Exanthemachrysis gayraliae, Strain RCC1523" /LENGTH=88 /DNA_ID=CAMNT_0053399581 /DNA_START=143 /DNA_END=404 /DNA_ORIENTATION=-
MAAVCPTVEHGILRRRVACHSSSKLFRAMQGYVCPVPDIPCRAVRACAAPPGRLWDCDAAEPASTWPLGPLLRAQEERLALARKTTFP